MPKTVYFDGRNAKSLNPWDVDSQAGWINYGKPTQEDTLWARTPWFYRGIKDRANNVSSMPWAVYYGDEAVSDNATWASKKPKALDFITNPRRLFSQIEQSMVIAGKAYLALECNDYGVVKNIRYLSPTTIDEKYDKATGDLIGYERTVNGKKVFCSRADQPYEKGIVQIVAIYDPDYMTEIGPGTASDGLAAMTAAGVLMAYDTFTKGFFERGAIKASILSIENGTEAEQRRLQTWWEEVVSGVKGAFTGLVLRGKFNPPIVIGEGIEAIDNGSDGLITKRRQDIATALGIPESRLWSSAANYATRKEDEVAYYRGTIIPECDLIREALNEQLFNEYHNLKDWRIEFQPETLDVFQEDETQRASSLQALVSAGVPLKLAMEILGYDLTDEQWEELEPEEVEPPAPEIVQPDPAVIPETAPLEEVEDDTAPAPEMSPDMLASIRSMLKNWQRKSLHVFKMTQQAAIPWTTDLLPASQVADITASLSACETAEQIKGVFANVAIPNAVHVEISEPTPELASELKRATDLLETIRRDEVKTAPYPQPVNVNAYFSVSPSEIKMMPAPEVKIDVAPSPAPVVQVTNVMPDQPAPVVTVEVNPTPITIDNTVNVPPAQSARVIRDTSGKITGLEAQ